MTLTATAARMADQAQLICDISIVDYILASIRTDIVRQFYIVSEALYAIAA